MILYVIQLLSLEDLNLITESVVVIFILTHWVDPYHVC
jgi:hypothetical protein